MSVQITNSRETTAISELTGEPINTWSEEWQHECEARAVLKMSKADSDAFFNGTKDENGKSVERGNINIRGVKAAESLKALLQRLLDVRASRGIKGWRPNLISPLSASVPAGAEFKQRPPSAPPTALGDPAVQGG